ncbi:hypothetical protein [Echinicola arenosa]|nr:hypothetical protein [Echinicola arenosa]
MRNRYSLSLSQSGRTETTRMKGTKDEVGSLEEDDGVNGETFC